MRIVIDMQGAQTASRFRGIGRYTLGFAKAVVRERGRHEVILMLSGLFPETVQPIRDAFRTLLPRDAIVVWQGVGPVAVGHEGNELRRSIAEVSRESFLASLRPDIIHICSLFEGYVDDAVASIGRFDQQTPVSVTLYDLIPLLNGAHYFDRNARYRDFYMTRVEHLKQAACFLAISEFSRQEGLSHLGIAADRFYCTYLSIEDHFKSDGVPASAPSLAALRARIPIREDFILYTGGADERKNLPALIRAYAQLPQAQRQSYQLVLAGKIVGGEMHVLHQAIAGEQLAKDAVVFTGYVTDEELHALYRHCALFVFPSWHEGFGLPALEAMACGAPVIAANTSSLPEVVGTPEALFDPFDVTAISAKMASVLTDPALAQRLRAHGRKQAQKFSWNETARLAWQAWELTCTARADGPLPPLDPLYALAPAIALQSTCLTAVDRLQLASAIASNVRNGRVRYCFLDGVSPQVSSNQDEASVAWIEVPVQWLPELSCYVRSPRTAEQAGTVSNVPAALTGGDRAICGVGDELWLTDAAISHAKRDELERLAALGVAVGKTGGHGRRIAASGDVAEPIRRRQLMLDISELVQRDARTGIQRVVRSLLNEWLTTPPPGFSVQPVYTTVNGQYRYARRYTAKFLSNAPLQTMADDSIEYASGDLFFGMDLQPEVVPVHAGAYAAMRAAGVCVAFMVYDLLPSLRPQDFPTGAQANFEKWLSTVIRSDGAICISKTVAGELRQWCCDKGVGNGFSIGWAHLGADLARSVPSTGLPGDAESTLMRLTEGTTFIMVGTIEPRKGYRQVIDAFTLLWRHNYHINLVVVGKPGWNTEAIVEDMRRLSYNESRFVWEAHASDEYLEELYKRADCLIAASYGEGFGLPIVEAAQRNIPVLARDIPVFREVGGEAVSYFSSESSAQLMQDIDKWLKSDHDRSKGISSIRLLSWRKSANEMMSALHAINSA